MNKYNAVLLDMDGTIADTYAVPHWLEDLRDESVRPFLEAKPLISESKLLSLFTDDNIVICTMLPKGVALGTPYANACQQAKREWLNKHFPNLKLTIIFKTYGDDKSMGDITKNCLLVDDNPSIRANFNGYTLSADALWTGGDN